MQPAKRPQPQALYRRLRPRRMTAGVALIPFSRELAGSLALGLMLGTAWPALAQTAIPASPPAPAPSATPAAADSDDDTPVQFAADKVEYANDSDVVTARGNVVLRREEQSVRADTITWNRKTGAIQAQGNVRMVDDVGNIVYTDKADLTEELKAGAMDDLLVVMREGGRLAAKSGEREDNGDIILHDAAYSGCAIEDIEGCAKKPSWEITAVRVHYDDKQKRVRYKGAVLHVFGVPLLPLPGLAHTSDFRAVSGLLIPDFRLGASNGAELGLTWYWRIAQNKDLAVTGNFYTGSLPMVKTRYRQLTESGAFQITGYLTRSSVISVSGNTGAQNQQFRGYFEGNGRFQLSDNWSISGYGRIASDRTFLRRYDLGRDDRLRSSINLERIDDNSYFSLAGWAVQTLRVGYAQGQVPIAIPAIDYRRRLDMPGVGGKLELQANTLAITRTGGQDTQRAFARAQWDLRTVTGMGQVITLTGLLRGDVYHSDQNALTPTVLYRGNPGWQARGIATAAIDVRWPFVGEFLGGTQVLTPRFQIVATPHVRNLSIPNEDSRSVDLDDANLFSLNRFPGYDRIEDGVRFTYGLDWSLTRPGWRISSTVGQSYRLSNDMTLLPDGTGLTTRASDIVGRTDLRFGDIVKFTHRFRLDHNDFVLRRNEFDATIGGHKSYFEVGYLRLNRDIASTFEDLRDRQELRFTGRVAFAKYWSVFGSGVVNLTPRAEDPTNTASDGFQMLRHRLGFAYTDDCLDLSFTWVRDYVTTGDAKQGNGFSFSLSLRSLGGR